ncbi:hypothetical protein LXL04_038106 [Taraxacum kok-saghyz]
MTTEHEIFRRTTLSHHRNPTTPNFSPLIRYHTTCLYRLLFFWALRITGYIDNKPITILIDSGSTHNIVQPRIVHHLRLPTVPVRAFPVMVGNGAQLQCTGFCRDTQLQLDHTIFTVPLFILPIEGADLVLGMAWLRTLGTVVADFSIPQMTFPLTTGTFF